MTFSGLLLSYYFLLSKTVSTVVIVCIQTSDRQYTVMDRKKEGTQGQPACPNKPNHCELCAFLLLSHSRHRRKLTVTFLPVNSEVADMKRNQRVTARI